ncbi:MULTISPECIES: hypothetical protein [unclassified Brevundimonas]|uniref:hypothetical protein n=1 Tax=unclassified Brevundimonas TaxID=2622653 RepID=UPI0025B92287|nr:MULTISPECIES: hypothetical protein [unclassified Brevundimonas]
MIREALTDARRIITEERTVLVACCTVGGDLATLDPTASPHLAEYDAALAKIDAALETLP